MLPDEHAACENCGAAEAYRFATATLCQDCYAERGTCGAGGPEAETDDNPPAPPAV